MVADVAPAHASNLPGSHHQNDESHQCVSKRCRHAGTKLKLNRQFSRAFLGLKNTAKVLCPDIFSHDSTEPNDAGGNVPELGRGCYGCRLEEMAVTSQSVQRREAAVKRHTSGVASWNDRGSHEARSKYIQPRAAAFLMRSIVKYLLTLLALSAVVHMQVFGLQRGFVCECGSTPKVIFLDHCDSYYHGDACHEGEEDVAHSKEEHAGEEPSREHSSYKEEVSARTLAGKPAAPQPAMQVILCLEWTQHEAPKAHMARTGSMHFTQAGLQGQRWPQMLARTIMLRV